MVEPELARRLVTAARKGREWYERRDRLVVEAIEAGASQREVAKLAGLTQPGVHAIWKRHTAGTRPPAARP
jgi:hypothetical protein